MRYKSSEASLEGVVSVYTINYINETALQLEPVVAHEITL